VQGTRAQPAGLFRGGAGAGVLLLRVPVRKGATVGVTVEPARGSTEPTSPMLLRASV
jgi:hypothetical protein